MIWSVMYSRWGLGATIGSHAAYNLVIAGLFTSFGG
jgi:membrane protease YdiL (CAAX protease family)